MYLLIKKHFEEVNRWYTYVSSIPAGLNIKVYFLMTIEARQPIIIAIIIIRKYGSTSYIGIAPSI